MPYIGRPLNAGNLAVQSGTGDGSDTTPIATLDYSVGSSNSIGVYLDAVRQLAGTDFTASGTVLTFTTAPANLVGIDVYFLGLELSIPTPADATVTTAKIVDDAVTLAKMASGTDGNIISYDASGNPVAIATGSNGQVLTSTGAGSPPAFEALPAGNHPVGARAYRTGTQSVSHATWTQVAFNTESYDPNGVFDHSSGYDYVVEANGSYLITSTVYWAAWNNNVRCRMQIYVNGSGVVLNLEVNGGTWDAQQCITDILSLSASDSVEIWVYQESGGSENITAGADATFMSVQRIG